MASYKQIVLDIKDYISMEIASIDHILDKKGKEIPFTQRVDLIAEKSALKDVADIIKEGGK